jgi:hypothetical protein
MRHLHPCTKEPRGPLWLGLVLLAGGLLLLAVLLTGCASSVSAGPFVEASGGLGYESPSAGVDMVVERPGFRASAALSTARKAGSDKAGGAELRVLAGKDYDRFGLYAGLRGFAQRFDTGTVEGSNPTLAAYWRVGVRARLWLLYDGPDSTIHDTQALRLEGEMGDQLIFVPACEYVYFDGGHDGWGCSAALRWRLR